MMQEKIKIGFAEQEFKKALSLQKVSFFDNCMRCNKAGKLVNGICFNCYKSLRENMNINGLTSEENEILSEIFEVIK